MIIKTSKKLFDKKNIIYAAIIFIFAIFITPGFSGNFKSFITKSISSFSFERQDILDRILLAKSSLQIFYDNPLFGVGPGGIKKLLPLKEKNFLDDDSSFSFVNSSYAHNDYLQILSETGVTGMLLFILLIFLIIHKTEKNIINFSKKKYLYILCILNSVFFILLEAFFNFPLFIFPSAFLFFFFSGLLYANVIEFENNKIHKFSYKYKIFIILVFLPLILFFFSNIKKVNSNIYLSYAIKQTYSDSKKAEQFFKKSVLLDSKNFYNFTNFGTFYFNTGALNQSLENFKQALKIYPFSPDIYYNIGVIYELEEKYKMAINNYKMALFFYPEFEYANLRLYNIFSTLYPDKENEYLIFLYNANKSRYRLGQQMNNNFIYLKESTFLK